MRREVTILYRGPLSSCNYDCSYCPFAKRHENAAELKADRVALERFVEWVSEYRGAQLSVFFTPWGEALTRRWYQTALQRISQLPYICRIAVQTNLSWDTDWLNDCDTDKLGLWCTYHPSEIERTVFLQQSERLRSRNVRHSVGMVALPEDFDEIACMRQQLPEETYLWLNAWEVEDGQKYQYTREELRFLTGIDPHFETNTIDHPSLGKPCNAGSEVFSVNGDGDVRRCHFVDERLGNIYDQDWQFPDASLNCPNQTCSCHIGYVHMPHLKLQPIYSDQLLERIPAHYS